MTDAVKRYDIDVAYGCIAFLDEDPDGDYVEYEDYKKLEDRLAEWRGAQHYAYIGKDGKTVLARDLEAKIEELEEQLANLSKAAQKVVYSYLNNTDGVITGMYDLEQAVKAARKDK